MEVKRLTTVQELIKACSDGQFDGPLVLDNDTTDAYVDPGGDSDLLCVFSMHPDSLLRALLDHVGIPWEEC